ncbi:GMC family oxidoreductase N-terminal domain-containing protein [Rhodophyticola sp.]|uniref:GMC family oxidoreductase N-terminal domain-containing protein n=1 Tax=Rhodophyticola sp. TaxID=2680032 RepID=UPI003D29755F
MKRLNADVAIVGGGACGLTLARALAGRMGSIVVLESGGLTQDDAHEALNAVDIADGCWSAEEFAARDLYHRSLTTHWDGARQTYGLRCRGLGGSTQAWAGKSAVFEQIAQARDWVPLSGWPVSRDALAPWLAQAGDLLNLGPGPYDATLWDRIGHTPPEPSLSDTAFRTVFWKFARSRRSVTDIMRFGADFVADPPDGVRVLTNATVTRILTDPEGCRVAGLEARSLAGHRIEVAAPICILAASTIENARLLLVSRDADPRGLGNRHDTVGRYLTDHPTATIARFDKEAAPDLASRFGLYGYRQDGRTHVYMHGLALDPAWQRAERALNGALFVNEERADDDPFTAARRILKRQSPSVLKDAMCVARSPVRIVRGATARCRSRGITYPGRSQA